MRCGIFLLVLLSALCYGAFGQENSAAEGSIENSSDQNNNSPANEDNDNLEGSSNSDYSYPCEDSGNIDKTCVRNYFKRSFQCIGAIFDDRQPVYRKSATAFMPKANITLKTHGDVLTFSGSKIEKFYVNRRSRNIVMTVSFSSIKIESRVAVYMVHQRGEEPAIAGDSVNVTYVPTLTAVIPISRRRINVRQATVTAYNYDPNPSYEMGPQLAESSNPVVAKAIDALFANFDTVVQEVFLTEAYNFFIAFMQSQVCFFGIPLSN